MRCLSPELKIWLGDLLNRPVASFGCQIWGVNFLDLGKGVDGNARKNSFELFTAHGVGKLWNSLQSNEYDGSLYLEREREILQPLSNPEGF